MTSTSVNPVPAGMDFFHDPDVEEARLNNGRLQTGCWTLRVPRLLGFCGGVVNAVRAVQKTIEENPGRQIWILGEIIHNDTVNNYFRSRGVTILDETEVAASLAAINPGDIVVVPAFGVEYEIDIQLRQLHPEITIVDTTCPKVRHIWNMLNRRASEKRTVVIFGKPSHPETRATLSRALNPGNSVILVPDIAHAIRLAEAVKQGTPQAHYPGSLIKHPKLISVDHLALVNQTTMLYEETKQVESILREAVNARNGTLESSETVCRATQRRQDAAREVCRDACDLILVIGGYSSSNTTQLYRVACTTARTFFINSAECLQADCLVHYVPGAKGFKESRSWRPPPASTIGLLAGASCPASDIGNVIRRLRQLAP